MSTVDEILSVHPSANVFVFEEFNVYHKDWLTYSGGNDRPGEFYHNFSISNDLTQMFNFPIRISDSDSHGPALLNLFISSDAIICSTMSFPPLENSDHVFVSVSISFLPNSQQDASFYRTAYGCSRVNWDGLCGHLRNVSREDIFNSVLLLMLVKSVSGFRLELMYVSLIVSIRPSLTHLNGFQLLVLLP